MAERQYWLDLFTYKTWTEFLRAGGSISGFRESCWTTVQKIKPGDYLLCYLTGISRWIGVLEVTGKPYLDTTTRIWDMDQFPARVPVRIVHRLEPRTAMPILEMKDQLSIFNNLKSPWAWTGAVRASPARWKHDDGAAVVAAVELGVKVPKDKPFDPTKLAKTPPIFKAKNVGPVTIPSSDIEEVPASGEDTAQSKEPSAHLEIQYLLLKLGSDMGLDVWVARNDRGREFKGSALSDVPRLKKELPVQFDEATNNTIELIDVLWLDRNSIVAAFEVESTTSIYSGLLRMADLIAMQPNLNIPLFLVAPDERREKVVAEVNRPTFSRLSPPMNEMCRFVSFDALRERVQKAGELICYLRPEFVEEVAESCEIVSE